MKNKSEQGSASEHTPTPWKLRVVRRNGDEDGYEIYSSDGQDVSTDCHMLNKADAGIAVRAVNAHDELLNALRHLIFLSCNKYDDATWRNAWIKASEAVTRAEGK